MNHDDSQTLCNFLHALDESDVEVNDWEARFIESNLKTEHFSPKQREVIVQMMEKYGERIKWY